MKAFASPPRNGRSLCKSKHEFKGTDDDYNSKARVGYETLLSPYIEGGVGVTYPEGGEETTFTALEVGTKIKITDKFGAYGKWENIFLKMIPVIGKLKSAQSTSSEELKNETFTSPCGRFNCCELSGGVGTRRQTPLLSSNSTGQVRHSLLLCITPGSNLSIKILETK